MGWALPAEHCRYLPQPTDERTVLREVQNAAAEATDTLLVYYAGHGLLIGPEEDLYLAIPGAEAGDECLAYEKLQARLAPGVRRAGKTVVILDCCYGGRALLHNMSEAEPPPPYIEQRIAEKAEIDGVCVLTSAAATRRSLAPVGRRYTMFTGELIDILEHGFESSGEYLTMTAVYQELVKRMRQSSDAPEPQFGTRGAGGTIVLARNNAQSGSREAAVGQIFQQAPAPRGDTAEDRPLRVADPALFPASTREVSPVPRNDPRLVAAITDLARRCGFKFPGDRGTQQRDVTRVYEEQIPARDEELIAFYRWRRTLLPSRGIAITTWGIRLRSGRKRLAIPYSEINDHEFLIRGSDRPILDTIEGAPTSSLIVQNDSLLHFELALAYGESESKNNLLVELFFQQLQDLFMRQDPPLGRISDDDI
ncbi:caspase family protein [Actinomadura sp. WMMB 499]|uniref:caspase, EACC1-associated type n=1 Tax=Actinomadura sp. WMMB 499 TaxID=1219491 RepID=UPI0020C7A8E7|nr:caspase family protein [Actinomadura sp. WMMB 499]